MTLHQGSFISDDFDTDFFKLFSLKDKQGEAPRVSVLRTTYSGEMEDILIRVIKDNAIILLASQSQSFAPKDVEEVLKRVAIKITKDLSSGIPSLPV